MSCYPERDSHIRYTVKVVLNLSNYATKKVLNYSIGVNTSNLAAESDFIALKAEVDKIDINKRVNVPADLNNLKTKVDNLGASKLKTVLIDLKKVSDVADKKVVKITKFGKLSTNVNNLEQK